MIDAGESREQPTAEVTSCLLGKTNTEGERNKAEGEEEIEQGQQ